MFEIHRRFPNITKKGQNLEMDLQMEYIKKRLEAANSILPVVFSAYRINGFLNDKLANTIMVLHELVANRRGFQQPITTVIWLSNDISDSGRIKMDESVRT